MNLCSFSSPITISSNYCNYYNWWDNNG